MNVAQLLTAAVAAHPERAALLPEDGATGSSGRARAGRGAPAGPVTYRALDDASAAVAGALIARGVAPGDRVVLLVRPSAALFAAVVGVLRVGATAVFLDRRLLRSGAADALAAAAPRAIVGGPGALALRRAVPGLGRIPVGLAIAEALRAAPATGAVAAVDEDAPALVTFSGGTASGGARAVVRTHATLVAQHRALAHALPASDGDVDYTAFPIVTLHNLAAGVPTVLPARPFAHPDALDARALLAAFERHGVTTASAAPTFWRHVADGWRQAGARAALRRIAIGGAPLPPRLPGILAAVAPGAALVGVYGGSEAEPVAILRVDGAGGALVAAAAEGRGYALGAPVAEARVRIADAAGDDVGRAGGAGRILVAGAHVAVDGAAPQTEDGAPAVPQTGDGAPRWHDTGDVGYADAGGLWLVGRASSVASGRAGPLHAGRVEAAAEALPFVRRAAAVRVLGRDVLVVVPEDGQRALADGDEGRARLAAAWRAAAASARASLVAADVGAGDGPDGPGAPAAPDEPPLLRVARDLPLDRRHHARVDHAALRRRLVRRMLPANLARYLAERFPPLQYSLLIASYFGANYFLARAVDTAGGGGGAWRLVAGAVVLWLMFFHLRVVDEHKDAARDLWVHPERALSRGLVTLGHLRRLGLAAVGVELALSAALGPAALAGCLIVLGLTALIARDFFAARFLERRMLANAAVHMAIMPAYGLYAYAVATGRPPWSAPPIVLAYACVGYGVGFALEIARKIRAPGDERPGLLTYSAALGPHRAAYAMVAALVAAGVLSMGVGHALGFGAGYHAAVAGLLALAAYGAADFRRRTDRRRAARLQAYASVFILAYDALLVAALALGPGLGRP